MLTQLFFPVVNLLFFQHFFVAPMEHQDEEEPFVQYVPTDLHLRRLDADLFTQSLLLLSDGLASGALLQQYEQLYRKNPDLAITEAKKNENFFKNRYRDISPCKLQQNRKKVSILQI